MLHFNLTHGNFGLRDAMVAILWVLTNNSESQSTPMLLERHDNPLFNVKRDDVDKPPGTIKYSLFLSLYLFCLIFILKPRRRADSVTHRKLPIDK